MIKQQSTVKKNTNADLTSCLLSSSSGKCSLEVEGGGVIFKITPKIALQMSAEPALVNSVNIFVGMVFDVNLPVDNQL
jgi:hypothetical protein